MRVYNQSIQRHDGTSMLWAIDLHNTLLRPTDPHLWEAAFGDVLAPLLPDIRRRVCGGLPELMAVAFAIPRARLNEVSDYLLRGKDRIKTVAEVFSLPSPTRQSLEVAEEMRRFHDDNLTLFDDAASPFLKILQTSDVPVVFCSETPVQLTSVLEREGFSGIPVVYSCDAGVRKANGALFASLQRRFGAEQMVVIGDSWKSDGLGALAAGATAQIVRRNSDDPIHCLSHDLSSLVEKREEGMWLNDEASKALAPLCPNGMPAKSESLIRRADGSVSLKEWTGISVIESLDMLTLEHLCAQ